MLLPTKHINLSESILGLSGYLLDILKNSSLSLDEIWKTKQENNFFKGHSIENVVSALDVLFMIGLIDVDKEGKVFLL